MKKTLEHRARPHSPWYSKSISGLAFAILYFPLLALMIYSFVRVDPATRESSWTLDFYREAFTDETLRQSISVSFWVAVWSTLLATLLGTTAALAIDRYRFPGRQIFDAFTLIPLVIPEIVMGLSLLIWFVALRISLGSFSMILAHTSFSFSYVIITVKTRLHDFDHSLEEAARDLGASSWQTFWKVTFPLIAPGILSGALMAFTLSFDDFLISFFTAGVGSDTLPIKLYSMIKFGISPKINALSTIILGLTVFMVLFIFRPHKKPSHAPSLSERAEAA